MVVREGKKFYDVDNRCRSFGKTWSVRKSVATI
jgi:hypothetical protein